MARRESSHHAASSSLVDISFVSAEAMFSTSHKNTTIQAEDFFLLFNCKGIRSCFGYITDRTRAEWLRIQKNEFAKTRRKPPVLKLEPQPHS